VIVESSGARGIRRCRAAINAGRHFIFIKVRPLAIFSSWAA